MLRASIRPVERVRFGPQKIALVPVAVALFGALPLATSSPLLAWLVLLPLAAAVWVLRARVVAEGDRLEVCNGLGRRTVAWDEVEGIDVPRYAPVRLLLTGGRRVALTALGRPDVRRLLALAPRRST